MNKNNINVFALLLAVSVGGVLASPQEWYAVAIIDFIIIVGMYQAANTKRQCRDKEEQDNGSL